MTASLRTHTAAVIAALEAGSVVVGDSTDPEDPHGAQGADWIPYVILYTLGATTSGGYVAPHEDALLTWQATCVGRDRHQAEWMVDRCNTLLEGLILTVAGRSVDPIDLDLVAAGARRDDDVKPPVFFATPRYWTTSRPA